MCYNVGVKILTYLFELSDLSKVAFFMSSFQIIEIKLKFERGTKI